MADILNRNSNGTSTTVLMNSINELRASFLEINETIDSIAKYLNDHEDKLEKVSVFEKQIAEIQLAIAEIKGNLNAKGEVNFNLTADKVDKVDASTSIASSNKEQLKK